MKIFSMLTVGLAFAGGQQTQNTAVGDSSHKNLEKRLEKLSNEFSDCMIGVAQDHAVKVYGSDCREKTCFDTIRYQAAKELERIGMNAPFYETEEGITINPDDQLSLFGTSVASCLKVRKNLESNTLNKKALIDILLDIAKPIFEATGINFEETGINADEFKKTKSS